MLNLNREHEKIFRIHYRLSALQPPATRSLASRQLAMEFIRSVLDGEGVIDQIKYDGKPITQEATTELIEAAKNMPQPQEPEPVMSKNAGTKADPVKAVR